MKVILRYRTRKEVEMPGRKRVRDMLRALGIAPSTVLVIRDQRLLTADAWVEEQDVVEVQPVISGGAGDALH